MLYYLNFILFIVRLRIIFFCRNWKGAKIFSMYLADLQHIYIWYDAMNGDKKTEFKFFCCNWKFLHTGLPLIIHLKIPWLFPAFFLTFYSFPYPLTDKKSFFSLYFEGANFFTSNLGDALNGRNLFAPQGSKFFPLRAAPIEVGD